MKVLKFGGTSVANSEGLTKVIEIIKNNTEQLIVVVSAFGGITNLLIEMAEQASQSDSNYKKNLKTIEEIHLNQINFFISLKQQSGVISFLKSKINELEEFLESLYTLNELTQKSLSKISSFGEILSSTIIYHVLKDSKFDVDLKDSREILFTHRVNDREVINNQKSSKKAPLLFKNKNSKIIVLPGFIAQDEEGNTTTLGRGGSDYTASLLANYVDASILEIWTDVSGVYTANPKLVNQAQPIDKLSFQEAMELSHFGATVIYPPTLQPLIEKNIPLQIKNTFDTSAKGTVINENNSKKIENSIVKGVSHIENVSLVNLEGSGMIGIPGFSKRFFECISEKKINIIMITQASSEHSICIGVKSEDALVAKKAIDEHFAFEISLKKIEPAKIESNMTNIAIVGDRMKDHQGISGRFFSSLGANNINIRAIAQGASERNISIVIDKKNTQKALNTIHESFF